MGLLMGLPMDHARINRLPPGQGLNPRCPHEPHQGTTAFSENLDMDK